MGIQNQNKRKVALVIVVLVIILAAVIVPLTVLGELGVPGQPPPGTLPLGPPPDLPAELKNQPPPNRLTPQELAEADKALQSGSTNRVPLSDGTALVTLAGPATRGATIKVGGVELKLPDDAQLEGMVMGVEYDADVVSKPGFRPFPAPAYVIVPNGARIFVSEQTGEYQVKGGIPVDYQFVIDALGRERQYVSGIQ
jgi:hypothetical protein